MKFPGRIIAVAAIAGLGLVPASARAALAHSSVSLSIESTTDGKPQPIPATLLKPEGQGPFPAVVILHDCSGLGPRSSGKPYQWGQLLAGEGYVAIIPDSFLPRGYANGVCTLPFGESTDSIDPLSRAADAYAALAYLRTLPYVDGKHVAVMGGSHGGSTTLAVMFRPLSPSGPLAAEKRDGFAAAIGLYPGCGAHYGAWQVTRVLGRGPVTGYIGTYQPLAPLLILIGEKDDWTPAADCEALAERAAAAGYPVTIKVYPGAFHAFDGTAPPRYLDTRRNVNKPDGHGATTGGDPAAWSDSIAQVNAFFAKYLRKESAAPEP